MWARASTGGQLGLILAFLGGEESEHAVRTPRVFCEASKESHALARFLARFLATSLRYVSTNSLPELCDLRG